MPPRIGSRITGAEITFVVEHDGERLARRSAASLRANLRAPIELKRKLTIGSPVRWSKPGCASIKIAAGDEDALLDEIVSLPFSRLRGSSESGGSLVGHRLLAPSSDWSSMRKSSLAVLPMSSLQPLTGPAGPGPAQECGRSPGAGSCGSTRPSWLTRRSMIWIDWSTVWRMRSMTAASEA